MPLHYSLCDATRDTIYIVRDMVTYTRQSLHCLAEFSPYPRVTDCVSRDYCSESAPMRDIQCVARCWVIFHSHFFAAILLHQCRLLLPFPPHNRVGLNIIFSNTFYILLGILYLNRFWSIKRILSVNSLILYLYLFRVFFFLFSKI